MPQDGNIDPDNPDFKTDWAERRTDWAEDRTILANERTFAGWIRTGLTAIAIAVGLRVIFGEGGSIALGRISALIFLSIAVLLFWGALIRAGVTMKRLTDHSARPVSTKWLTFVAVALTLATLFVGYILMTL